MPSQASSSRGFESTLGAMFQLTPRQRDALQEGARRLRERQGGAGRADASRLLRALIEDSMERGSPLPDAKRGEL